MNYRRANRLKGHEGCITFDGQLCTRPVTKVVTWLDGRTIRLCSQCYAQGLRYFEASFEDARARLARYVGASDA